MSNRAQETIKQLSRLSQRLLVWCKKKGVTVRALLGTLILASVLIVVVGGVSSAIVFAWLSRTLPDPNNIRSRQVAQSTKIFDREGKELLYEIHGEEKRTVVDLQNIPEKAREATIAIEDKQFYHHRGFRITSLVRAVIANALARRKVQGGSTITQQLVKNAILTNQKTFARKIKELVIAYEIERRFTKDEILKLYFNEIPYGSNAYGIEAASQTYFGKSARELDLVESAMLAALPKGPTYYSPYGNHRDDLLKRTHLVIDEMKGAGFISEEEARAAKSVDILARIKPRREAMKAPHFVIDIKEILTERYGERMVEQGGLKVITTLDWKKQKIAEQAVADNIGKVEQMGGSNAALIAVDPKTGEVLAMVGSRDYFDTERDGNVNVTTRPRQPGSSFKPIVYAAAFERGYTPDTVLYDVDTIFHPDGRDYHPRNYDQKERGPVTVRTALAGSLNIPAVKTMYLAGRDNVLDFAERLGYSTLSDRSRFGLAVVLGGAEVKPIEHAAAFAAFATEGVYHGPQTLLKVEGPDGKTLDEWRPNDGKKVMEPEIAREINDILSDNSARSYIFGAKNWLTLPDRPVAAKTGTTNDFHDAWTAGYSPSLVTVVWTGNNDNSKMKTGADGSKIAAPIWNQFMREALKGTPVESFTKPALSKTGKPVLDGQSSIETVVKIDRASGKLATDLTPPSFIEEHKILSAHCILHYVNKDDPRGPVPENPSADPEYNGWEAAVQEWIKKNATTTVYENFTAPTETDNLHTQANWPNVTILSPTDGAMINSREISVSATASAPRGVSRVQWYLDGALVGIAKDPTNWGGDYKIPNRIGIGYHTLEARAFDVIDNSNSTQIQVNITSAPEGVPVIWASPQNNAVIKRSEFPVTISATLGNAAEVKTASLVVVSENGAYRHTPASFTNHGIEPMTATWRLAPEAGSYFLRVELELDNGAKTVLPDQIQVTIQ